MKKKNGQLLVLIWFIFMFLSGCRQINSSSMLNVMLIAEEDASSFGKELIEGMDTATSEYSNVNLLKRLSAYPNNASQEKSFLEQAIQLGVDAVVLSPSAFEKNEDTIKKAQKKGIAVILMNNQKYADSGYSYVGSNMEQLKKKVENIIRTNGISQPVALVLSSPKLDTNSIEKEKEWTQAIKEAGNGDGIIKPILRLRKDELQNDQTLSHVLNENPDINVVIALTETMATETEKILQNQKEMNKPLLIASQSSMPIIKKLETGNIDVMIRENAFEIGYTAIQLAVEQGRNQSKSRKFFIDITEITQ